jgi:hypothetical protein
MSNHPDIDEYDVIRDQELVTGERSPHRRPERSESRWDLRED